jgi:isoleucyl-tRNA synthetase
MMKKAQQANFPEFEAEMLAKWAEEKTFERSLEQRKNGPRFSFYDGPPFANGLPHFGHSLVTSIKDSLGRYHTMKGEYVERRNGWDCHGLPVEFAIEKEFGVSGKKQILELGLDKFNEACRDSVFKYKGEWEEFFRRIGRWTDTAHSYQTIDRDFTESVWWVLSQVNAKGLLYRGYKSMPYCPRCETPLSNFEVNEGYKDNVPDPSLYVKFKLVGEDASLLGWTTTPWSLPGNAAVAVKPGAKYVYAEVTDDDGGQEVLVLAKARLEALKAKYKVLREVEADELVGKSYEPVFDMRDGLTNVYKVWLSDAVSIEDGTGVLHVAPAFGEDDLNMAVEHKIPVITTVQPDGKLSGNVPLESVRGKFFKGADKLIIERLTEEGKVYAAETFEHTYPFCYRCDSPLLYYAISTWFVKVSAIREELLKTAEQIEWTPAHIKAGRFGKWLEGARDWAISRNRYWGAPMPIWVNEADPTDYLVVGSLDELVKLAGLEGKPEDLHRPDIDKIVIERDGKKYKRVEEVFDCWFESGSMPVAQKHFPFENKEEFEASFPADYIGEGLDQTRLWFYVQHVLSTIVFDKPAYRNVLVNGMILAADGRKLSKSLRNYPPVEDVFATEGADTLRFYLLGNDQALGGGYMRFDRQAMQDVTRNFFMTLWNSHSFLTMYAEIDGWQPPARLREPESGNVLDRWLVARLNETLVELTDAADSYQIARGLRALRELVDDLSNWYVRRSRRRFWKSEDDADKADAYATLHFVLARLAQMIAPWSPFVADKLWRDLMAGTNEAVSVHLSDWPTAGRVDVELLEQMAAARLAVTEGLASRAAAGVKVRQPLALLEVRSARGLSDELLEIVREEVNVKAVVVKADPAAVGVTAAVDAKITPELRAEGLMRDVVRLAQQARKNAGLQVDDRIVLTLQTSDAELAAAIVEHSATIQGETLAVELRQTGADDVVPAKVDGRELFVAVEQAAVKRAARD